MHDARVMLSGEYVTGAAHVGGELVDFIDALEDLAGEALIAKIAENKFVGGRLGEFMAFDIDGAYPEALLFQPFYQVSPDKSAGSVDQNSFHFRLALQFSK
jgi:hypothetical protein